VPLPRSSGFTFPSGRPATNPARLYQQPKYGPDADAPLVPEFSSQRPGLSAAAIQPASPHHTSGGPCLARPRAGSRTMVPLANVAAGPRSDDDGAGRVVWGPDLVIVCLLCGSHWS
jgi:hypothetical protein